MTNLISGADALRALADGKDVEFKCGSNLWRPLSAKQQPLEILIDHDVQFRLKPLTITINGIEVPCCGKDYQYGDAMYILNSLEPEEYSLVVLDKVDEVPLYWWRTEEEVKQVVAALRQVFDLSDDAVNAARGGK